MTLSESTQKLQKLIKTFSNPMEIPEAELKLIYQDFVDVLTDHNHCYYIEAKPIISDAEYDELFAYLKAIEEYFPHLISSVSPTQGLVAQLAEGFKKAEHTTPLLSLENSYNAEDIREWAQRVAKLAEKKGMLKRTYGLEAKFDGLSVEFHYEQGKLVQAITRGDGKIGEDITANVLMLRSIPKQLNYNGDLQVRGEIMMPKSQLLKLNQEREKKGQTPFSNTRNAAAGSIKLLDSAEVAKRGLIAYVYDQLGGEKVDLQEIWLPTFSLPQKFQKTEEIEQLIAWCQDFQLKQFLDEQDFDVDGLVIKLSDLEELNPQQESAFSLFTTEKEEESRLWIREILGATEHHPRRAIAYKFPAQQVASQILSLTFQVGRTGIITPVANIEPVQLSGATISRVSLHNFDFIAKKQIKNKDFVRVQRSGEVIPYLLGPIKERRSGLEEPIIPPLFCPECNSPITNIDIHYYCSNPSCPAQIKEKLVHFVSRDAMDISGIGEAMIELLVKQKMLTSFADIYSLTKVQNQILLRKFPNFWEKKISEAVSQIEASKQQPLWRVLHALGIPNVGKKIAQDLASYLASKQVKTLDELLIALEAEELKSLFGIGEKILEGIQMYIHTPETLAVLRALEAAGVNFNALQEEKKESWPSKGSFSLTGTFPLPRGELIAQIENLGYEYEEYPNSKTEIMLIGEKPGSKAEKAKKLGIPCFEGREAVSAQFPLVLKQEAMKKAPAPLQGGLF